LLGRTLQLQRSQGIFRVVQLYPDCHKLILSCSKARLRLILRALIGHWSEEFIGQLIDLKLERSLLILKFLNFSASSIHFFIPQGDSI
jgi:hypothetical protein